MQGMRRILGFFLIVASTGWTVEQTGWFLTLEQPCAASFYETRESTIKSLRSHLLRIEQEQQCVLNALAAKGITHTDVLYRVQRVANGVAVLAGTDAGKTLLSLPGVKGIYRLHRVRPSLESSVPFLAVPQVWRQLGTGGTGIRVGVIDTGIDYLHPDFGGTMGGLGPENNPTRIDDVVFPTAKVLGGWDFVGSAYNAEDLENSIPVPDPDPMDEWGHGTHVAGIIAGMGVSSSGEAYTGSYTTNGWDISGVRIAPGTAPQALLYALKIFGQRGTSFMLIPAMEWGVDPDGDGDFSDRLDVLNLSLGDPLGVADGPESQACNHAAALGCIVVASAGNSGNTFFATGAPGCAARVISVAATQDDDPDVEGMLPDWIAPFSARGPAHCNDGTLLLKPDLCAPGVRIRSAQYAPASLEELASTLSGTSMATPHVSGIMAILRAQRPDWSVAELKALVMNTATRTIFSPIDPWGGILESTRVGAGRIAPLQALSEEVLAFNADAPEQVGIVFRTREVRNRVEEACRIRIVNKGEETIQAIPQLLSNLTLPGVEVGIAASEVLILELGASQEVQLILRADATAMQRKRSPHMATTIGGYTTAFLNEVAGWVAFVYEDIQTGAKRRIHLPYYGAFRPVSDMHATTNALKKEDSEITIAGDSVSAKQSTTTDKTRSSAFELLAHQELQGELTDLETAAHLRYVGISSDYAACIASGNSLEDSTLFFAVVTHRAWTTPNWVQFRICIDTNEDGVSDATVYNSCNLSSFAGSLGLRDVFVSRLDTGEVDQIVDLLNYLDPAETDPRLFFSNTMILPVPVAALGLDETHTRFQFWVETYYYPKMGADYLEERIDTTAVLDYDPLQPALDFSGIKSAPYFENMSTTRLPYRYNASVYAERNVLGALLCHHHNTEQESTEWLPVITAGDSDGDTIEDSFEGGGDWDSDGVPNLWDSDADGDGISDTEEGNIDLDGDGAANFLDSDSDGDGLSDREERFQYGTSPYATDSDEDGRPDAQEIANGTNPLQPTPPEAPQDLITHPYPKKAHVQLTWKALPGNVEYQVYRSNSPEGESAPLHSGWLRATTFLDTNAPPTRSIPGRGCQGPSTLPNPFHYQVRARIAAGEYEPTLPGPFSNIAAAYGP